MAFQPKKKKIIMKKTLVSFEINPSGVLNPLIITLLTILSDLTKKKRFFFFYLLFSIFLAGHFLLTEMLLEKMVETAAKTGIQGRIINVTSVIHSWVKRDSFRFNQMLNPKK